MTHRTALPVMLVALLTIACTTTTTSPVAPNVAKSERVLGLDDDVRVEAILFPNPIQPSGNVVKIICEIENRRNEPIVIYDIESMAMYDPDTRTFTVNLGAELPTTGSQPVQILSSERRTFEQTVSLSAPLLKRVSNFVRVRLHFLKEVIQFSDFDDEGVPNVITWAEHKRTVETNSIPMF